MRRRAFTTAAVAGIVGGGIAAASSASANNSMPTPPTGARPDLQAAETPVLVLGGRNDEILRLVEPTGCSISEYSSVGGLTWYQWGPDVAIATGYLRGVWIQNEANQYDDVTVTLFDVRDGEFNEFWITGPFAQPEHPGDKTHGYFY
jgi:hypothetical protein